MLGNYWIALVVAVLVLGVLGAALDVVIFRPLQRHDPIVTVLVTFGVLMVLEDFAQTIWGKGFRSMPIPDILSGAVKIAGEDFPLYRLFVIVVAAAVGIGLTLWLRFSRIGLFVRASSVDPVTTAVLGVNTDRVSMMVVAVGTALAGLSGTIAAPLMALSPAMGGYILVESFIVVVIGGLGSFSGALIAALVVGQIHNFGVVHVPWLSTMIPFFLMVIVLVWRPMGVAGNRH
jgi:branched-chain amino acid transport system permease protein